MRLSLAILFLLLSEIVVSQTSIQTLKTKDNLSEFIYIKLDDFAKNPQVSALKTFLETEKQLWRLPNSSEEQLALLYLKINKAFYYKEFGFLNEAANFYEEAYQHFKNHDITNYDIIEYCLKPLLNTYTRLGAYERAETIGVKIIETANAYKKHSKHRISGYLNLAAIKRSTGAYKKAIEYLNEAISFNLQNEQKAKIYSDLAINYLFLDDFVNVNRMIELSNNFNKTNNFSIQFRNLKTIGLVHVKTNRFHESISFFKEALKIAELNYGEYNREVAKLFNLIGQSYIEIGNETKALQFYQESLKKLLPGFSPLTTKENPEKKLLYAENTLIEALEGKARVADNQNLALNTYNLAFEVEKLLRNSAITQKSKLLMQQESRMRSELCIEICYKEFQNTNDKKWLEKAFQYAEKSKAIVLAETKKEYEKSLKFNGDTLFLKKEELQYQTSQVNTTILNEQMKSEKANVNVLASLNAKKDSLFNHLAIVNKQIGLKYPEIVEELELIAVAELKNSIEKNQLFIEFFSGEDSIYIFKISQKKGVSMSKLSKSSVLNDIELFISFFDSERGSKLQNDVQKYSKTAFRLFKMLINDSSYEKLIIIPDGVLNLLSFDALLTEESTSTNFAKMPYLVKNTEVSYAFSSNLLFNEKTQVNLKKILGFFPIFENNHRNLATLMYTSEEAKSIENYFKGNYYLHNKAVKNIFKRDNSKYDIIHLSTHAFAGDFFSPPYIEFYDKKMQLPEIYGYNLNADLVVLSACETGIGVLRKGEGAMSLARGFSYAGVDNLVVSLWQVNDKSTQQLMTSFYKNLKKSKHISSSIRNSKLEYLNDNEVSGIKKSPYYWAGFVFLGEYQNEKVKTDNSIYYLALLLVGFIVFLVIKKQ
jgi:CHAT domain-containing protein/transcriptional regulator NrdR family protein